MYQAILKFLAIFIVPLFMITLKPYDIAANCTNVPYRLIGTFVADDFQRAVFKNDNDQLILEKGDCILTNCIQSIKREKVVWVEDQGSLCYQDLEIIQNRYRNELWEEKKPGFKNILSGNSFGKLLPIGTDMPYKNENPVDQDNAVDSEQHYSQELDDQYQSAYGKFIVDEDVNGLLIENNELLGTNRIHNGDLIVAINNHCLQAGETMQYFDQKLEEITNGSNGVVQVLRDGIVHVYETSDFFVGP